MASYDPSDYDSVYSEQDYQDVVRGATTPPLMNYEEFLAKTMGKSWIAAFFGYYKITYAYKGYTYKEYNGLYICTYLCLRQHTYTSKSTPVLLISCLLWL